MYQTNPIPPPIACVSTAVPLGSGATSPTVYKEYVVRAVNMTILLIKPAEESFSLSKLPNAAITIRPVVIPLAPTTNSPKKAEMKFAPIPSAATP